MILGADPDEVKPAKKSKLPPNEAQVVFDHFNFVARRMGAQPVVDYKDVAAFKGHTKRSLNRGLSVQDLRLMIDGFFQFDRHREHRCPWKLFWSTEVQRRMLAEGGTIRSTDPVMDWIGNDFCRTSDLPWSDTFDSAFQSLVHRTGMSVAYRYPDLLANIARIANGDTDLAERLLLCASSLIDQCLLGEDNGSLRGVLTGSGVHVPKDLKPKKVRRESMTLREAVLTAIRHN